MESENLSSFLALRELLPRESLGNSHLNKNCAVFGFILLVRQLQVTK